MEPEQRVIILGAAGRDFHDFNVFWKQAPGVRVVCFTAAQIPNIADRRFPAELAGPQYPEGIPIFPEERLEELIRSYSASLVALAYSDISHEQVMHLACRAQAAGAQFTLLGPRQTMLPARKPVIAVCAVRTGCGKSQTARSVARILRELGQRVAVVRHPMPYGNLLRQVFQRFATLEDLERAECTIEEREEYEPHIRAGNVVFAGVDYRRILEAAEEQADVILWDGGNNDTPFLTPRLLITLADAQRPGHELRYYPGETNARMADLIIINKVDSADPADVQTVENNLRGINPRARILRAESPLTIDNPDAVRGRRVAVVEDGPTLTHGGMPFGAGWLAARQAGAAEIVDPRPYAVGSLRETFRQYPHLTHVLPAMGYGASQRAELEQTLNRIPCDLVVVGTPIDLSRTLRLAHPTVRVTYELRELEPGVLRSFIARACELQAGR